MSNVKNPEGFRRCYLCNRMLSATLEFFPKDKNRPLGIGYQCRDRVQELKLKSVLNLDLIDGKILLKIKNKIKEHGPENI